MSPMSSSLPDHSCIGSGLCVRVHVSTCVRVHVCTCGGPSPLAAHAEHHDEDGDQEGRGSSDSTQQQDLAVGRSREVQPVLHGGHVGALALACCHTHALTHTRSCTLGSATVSLGSAGRHGGRQTPFRGARGGRVWRGIPSHDV